MGGLTKRKLAHMLKPFGIRPKTIWPLKRGANDKSARGYMRDQFERAWKSYCDTPSSQRNSKVRLSAMPSYGE